MDPRITAYLDRKETKETHEVIKIIPKKDQKCSNCYYWGLGRTTNAGNNACRFFPPSKNVKLPVKPWKVNETLEEWKKRTENFEITWVFPETHRDLWCGQWRSDNDR